MIEIVRLRPRWVLRDKNWALEYRTGESEPVSSFYRPALNEANTYYRAAGYFSSSSFTEVGETMLRFFENDGYMRLITSVHLSEEDRDAIASGMEFRSILEKKLDEKMQTDFQIPLKPGAKLLAKMIAKNRLDVKIATTMSGGLYHEKLGVIMDEEDDYVSFSGSQNESKHSYVDTYESIDVYTSWEDTKRAKLKLQHFEDLWDGKKKAKIYDLPEGIKKIIVKRARESPGDFVQQLSGLSSQENPEPGIEPQDRDIGSKTNKKEENKLDVDSKFSYQEDAVEWFVNDANGIGIYWMATGTGKTITAIKTIKRLFRDDLIDHVVLCASDRLLKQWKGEFEKSLPDGSPSGDWNTIQFNHIAEQKESSRYRRAMKKNTGLLLSTTYGFLMKVGHEFSKANFDGTRTLLIVDELHNIGANEIQKNSVQEGIDANGNVFKSSIFDIFGYRLGLSATPLNDFDDVRNTFVISNFTRLAPKFSEIEDWANLELEEKRLARLEYCHRKDAVFHVGLKDAIERGVLVEFDYKPLPFTPTQEEYAERQRVRRLWKKKIADGQAKPGDDAIHAARVFKKSPQKLVVFREFVSKLKPSERKELFTRSLIFVADMEFGREVGRILQQYDVAFHEFFNKDDPSVLELYRQNTTLDCLIACHMISEGVDIRSIENIILFSSDRQRLETIQRIGRALRIDPTNPQKRANILDFVNLEALSEDSPITADWERYNWLKKLQETRRFHHE
jgi:superfamily II DNA or RNA helicase